MRALILADRRHLGVSGQVESQPRELLKVGDRPLIEHTIRSCFRYGATKVDIVTGYKNWNYDYLADKYGVLLYSNGHFIDRGSLYSLILALDSQPVREPTLVIDGDVLFDPIILTGLDTMNSNTVITAAPCGCPNPIHVETLSKTEPMVLAMHSDPAQLTDQSLINGVFAGISLIQPHTFDRLIETWGYYLSKGFPDAPYDAYGYTTVAMATAMQNAPECFWSLHDDELIWARVRPDNLDEIHADVYPKIMSKLAETAAQSSSLLPVQTS